MLKLQRAFLSASTIVLLGKCRPKLRAIEQIRATVCSRQYEETCLLLQLIVNIRDAHAQTLLAYKFSTKEYNSSMP